MKSFERMFHIKIQRTLCIVMVSFLLLAGCGQEAQINEETPSSSEEAISVSETETDTEPEQVPHNPSSSNEPIEEPPVLELTEEEKAQLTFEADKLILIIGWTRYGANDLGFLKEKYPDIEMISEEYSKDINGEIWEDDRNEIWFSDMTGLSYHIYHWRDDKTSTWKNQLNELSGEVSALISGLEREVETSDLMNALDILESDWAIGNHPEMPTDYDMASYIYKADPYSATPDDIYIIVPDAMNPEKRYPNAIRITPARPGFISPTDEFIVMSAMAWP